MSLQEPEYDDTRVIELRHPCAAQGCGRRLRRGEMLEIYGRLYCHDHWAPALRARPRRGDTS